MSQRLNSFDLVGKDRRGASVLRQKWSGGQVAHAFCYVCASTRNGDKMRGLRTYCAVLGGLGRLRANVGAADRA